MPRTFALPRRSFLAAAALASCSRTSQKTVGVVPKGANHQFWLSVQAGAVKAGREFGFAIEWNSPKIETDTARQIDIIDSMINRRLAGIVLAPIDSKALVRVVQRAKTAKIPVAIFDSGLESPDRITYVATNNLESGRIAARRMGEILGGKGKVGVVGFRAGSASTMERESGFVEEIRAKFPQMTVLPVQYNEADRAKALAITENMLTAHPDLAGIFADNEGSSMGAVQGLKARAARSVKMIAYDASDQLVADLRSGWIDSILLQDPFKMGYLSTSAIGRHLKGETVEPEVDSGIRLITKPDLDLPDVQELLNPPLQQYLN